MSLNPGQSKRVTVALSHHSFAYWNTAANGWRVAPGCYSLMVGTSSADLPLQVELTQGVGACQNERSKEGSYLVRSRRSS